VATSGVSSGSIDVNTIVEQLMQIERKPLTALKTKETAYQAKISAYATLLSSVSALKSSVSALKGVSVGKAVSVSDTAYLTATASSTALKGTYSLNVKQIAKAQSLYSGTFASATEAVADLSSVTTQKMKIQVGSGTAVEITVDSSNNTLTGIRDAINTANAGVSAAIVQDGSVYRLTLSASATGASSTIKVLVDEDNNGTYEEPADQDATGLSRLASNAVFNADNSIASGYSQLSQSQGAQDAIIKINGLELSRAANTISDVISGVTLNLVKGDPNYATNPATITVAVSDDNTALKNKLAGLVSAYNGTTSAVNSLRGNAKTKGVLAGDATLLSLKNDLRSLTTKSYSASASDNTLAYLGLTHDKSGVLSIDTAKLDAAIAADPDKVVSMINAMATDFESRLAQYVNSYIPARKGGYESTVKTIQKQELNIESRLSVTEVALRKKYSSLDSLLSQLQSTSTYLTQQMDKLSKATGG